MRAHLTVNMKGATNGTHLNIHGMIYGLTITSNLSPSDVNINDYVAVIVPGGRAPDRMRLNEGLVKLVKDAAKKGKVIAAICHGAQLLIEAAV